MLMKPYVARSILLFTTILLLQVKSCHGAFILFQTLVEWYTGLLNLLQVDMSACQGPDDGPQGDNAIICVTLWEPVICNGICTYSNSCFARAAGVEGGCWP